MFSNKFTEIKDGEAAALLDKINEQIEGQKLNTASVKILSTDLNYYPSCSFIEVSSGDPLDKRQISLLQNNQVNEVYILNGTNEPIYKLNAELPIQLNKENVCAYARFFFSFVSGRHGRFLIIDSPDDIDWREEPAPNAKKALCKMIEPLSVISEDDQHFTLKSSIIFKNSIFETDVIVQKDGQITLTRQEILVEDIPVLDDIFGQ